MLFLKRLPFMVLVFLILASSLVTAGWFDNVPDTNLFITQFNDSNYYNKTVTDDKINSINGSINWNQSGIDIYNKNSGNVGIGTTSPLSNLDIYDTKAVSVDGQTALTIRSALEAATVGCGGKIAFTNQAGIEIANIRSYLEDGLHFGISFGVFDTSAIKESQLYIQSEGDVGVGTTTPDAKLHVVGDGLFNGTLNVGGNVYSDGISGFVFGSSTTEGERIDRSGNDLEFYTGGSNDFSIDGDTHNVAVTNDLTVHDLIICDNGTATIMTRNQTLATSMGC